MAQGYHVHWLLSGKRWFLEPVSSWTLGAPAWGRALVSNPPLLELGLVAFWQTLALPAEKGHGSSSFGHGPWMRNQATKELTNIKLAEELQAEELP